MNNVSHSVSWDVVTVTIVRCIRISLETQKGATVFPESIELWACLVCMGLFSLWYRLIDLPAQHCGLSLSSWIAVTPKNLTEMDSLKKSKLSFSSSAITLDVPECLPITLLIFRYFIPQCSTHFAYIKAWFHEAHFEMLSPHYVGISMTNLWKERETKRENLSSKHDVYWWFFIK